MPTSTALPTGVAEALAADAPLFIGRNLLESATSGRWFPAVGSTPPYSVLTDRAADPAARPNAPALSGTFGEWDAEFQLAGDVAIDAIAVMGHNFRRLAVDHGANVFVEAQVADDSAFSVNLTTIASVDFLSSATEDLDVSRTLMLCSTSYSGFAAFRLRVRSPTDFTGGLDGPLIGEIWAGERQQMPFAPQRPLDWLGTDGAEEVSTYPGGRQLGVTDFRGRGVWPLTWRLREDVYERDAGDILRTWWRQSRQGETSIFVPQPSSRPDAVYLVRAPSRSLEIAEVAWQLKEASLSLVEQPPFLEQELFG